MNYSLFVLLLLSGKPDGTHKATATPSAIAESVAVALRCIFATT
jgi:hypothetical protein